MSARQCNIDGCDRDGKLTRGMCGKHYRYWIDHTPVDQRGLAPRFARRFWDYVDKSDECWVWIGPVNSQGYGFWSGLGADGRKGLAHRLSLAATEEPSDPALFACHHCDNPPCVNPDHLYWGTAADNFRDMVDRHGIHNAGQRSSVCPRGHAIEGENLRLAGREKSHVCRECDNRKSREFQRSRRAKEPHKVRVPARGEAHGQARLTWSDVRAIRRLKSEGRSVAGLARDYGISDAHAWRIVKNQAWREDRHGAA